MKSQFLAGTRRLWAVLAIVAGLSTVCPATAAPFEKSLPADSLVFFNIANVSDLKTRVSETSLAHLFHDEAMKPFVDGLASEVQVLLDTVEQLTTISVNEMLSLPTGQVSLAVQLDTENPNALPAIYFLADCKGKESSLKDIIGKITTFAEENGIAKEMVGDLTVYTAGDPAQRQQVCYGIKGSVLLLGNDPEGMGKVVASLDAGADESLGASEKFSAFRDRAGGTGQIELYVDLTKAIEYAADQGQPEFSMAVGMLGLNAFDSAGISIVFGEDDNDSCLQLLVNTRGTSPLFNLLKMPAKPIKPETWVPADTVGYTSFNWDVDTFYDTLVGMINAVQPGAMEQVEAMLAGPDPNNPLLNIKNDLIGPLGNRISVVTDYIVEDNTPNPRILLAWELENSAKLTELFDRLMALAGGALPLETKSVNGNTVYTFPLGDLVAAQMPEGQMPFKLGVFGFTITKTHLMLATHVELLDKCLNSSGGGLAEAEHYKMLAAKMPAEVSLLGITRTDEEAKASWGYIKSGKLAELLRSGLEAQPDVGPYLSSIVDALDGSNLPEFEKVAKYFVPSGSYAIMDDKGIIYKSFVPKH